MRAITTRLRRLEERLAPEPDLRVWETAMILYERRRRRVEAVGQLFKELPPARPERGTRYLSAAETLRHVRQERLRNQADGAAE
jgi:hypothetical protein